MAMYSHFMLHMSSPTGDCKVLATWSGEWFAHAL